MSRSISPRRPLMFAALVLACGFLATAEPALAQQSRAAGSPDQMMKMDMGRGRGSVNTDTAGLAVQGYDVVAYQTDMRPMRGSEQFTAMHDGATYRFASAANRDRFMAEPTRYLPAYGGYCAMGVSVGRKFDVDPAAFTVVEGRLYLNKDLRTRTMWMRDIPGNNAKADVNWPTVMQQRGF